MKIQVKILTGLVTAETTAMVDSGATNNFINKSFVKQNFIRTKLRKTLISVKNIAGRQLDVVKNKNNKP